MYDLIVIGGGPAGMTAAIYAIRKRLNVLLVSKDLGGKTNFRLALPWVEDYQVIRGLEVVGKFRSELEYLEFARRMEAVEAITRNGKDFSVAMRGGETLQARAVILATGARQKLMRVPGEKEFMMRGLCYSALSYAPLFIDHTSAVIGDGELALRSAAELAIIASKVTLVMGNDGDSLDSPLGRKLRSQPNVEILKGYQVLEVKGDEYARKLVLKDPQEQTGELQADGFFIEMELLPNSGMAKGLVEMDASGRVQVDCANCTSAAGFFAAGDVTTSFAEQVLIAVGEGAKAALSAYEYLLPSL